MASEPRSSRLTHFLAVGSAFVAVGFASTLAGGRQAPLNGVQAEAASAPADVYVSLVGQSGGAARAVAVIGDHAIVGVGAQVRIVDIADPTAPREVYRSAVLRDVVADVAIAETTAYVVHGGQLLILDLSTPAQPRVLSHEWFHLLDDFRRIVVHEGFAYTLMDSLSPWAIGVIDVRDPRAPLLVNQGPESPGYGSGPFGWPRDIVAQGQYVFAAQDKGLAIVDVSDPRSPARIAEVEVANWVQAVDVHGDYVYLATDGGDDGFERGLMIYNVSVPERPWFVHSNGIPCRQISVDGTYAYAALTPDRLSVIDVSNPHVPDVVRVEDLGIVDDLVAVRGRVFVAEADDGVTMLHGAPAPPSDRTVVLHTFSPVIDIVADAIRPLAYAASTGGLNVVDLSTPSNPRSLSELALAGEIEHLAVDLDLVFAATAESGIHIVNVVQPDAPARIGNVASDGSVMALAAAEGLLVVADSDGLRVVDVLDPAAPSDVGHMAAAEWEPTGMAIAGGFAYVVDRTVGLRVFALSDSVDPIEIGRVEYRSSYYSSERGMALSGTTLYVPHGPEVVATPAAPPAGPFRAAGSMAGHVAAVAPDCPPPPPPQESRVLEIDVADPTAPRITGDLSPMGWPRGLATLDDYLFVASGYARYYTKALLVRERGSNRGFETELHLPTVPRDISAARTNIVIAAGDAGLLVVSLSDQAPPTFTPAPTREPRPSRTVDPNVTPSATPTGSTATPLPTPASPATPTIEAPSAASLYLPVALRNMERTLQPTW